MKLARFERIVAAYGSDPALWPAREAAAATALLVRSAQAQGLLYSAHQVEAALARTTGFGETTDAAVDRIMAAAFMRIDRIEQAKARAAAQRARSAWLMPAGFAFGALLLFTLGIGFGAIHTVSQDNQDSAAKLIMEGPYRSFASL